MKILLVLGSLFVFANAKNHNGGHGGGGHGGNHNAGNAAGVNFLPCFQTLLLSFDFTAPQSNAQTQVDALCASVVQASGTFGHKMVINNVTQAYKAMSPGDIAQAKANQTANNTAGIIQYFRAKIAAMGGSVAMFNQTIAFIYAPLVKANWQTTITAFNLNQPANKNLKKSLAQDLKQGQDMAAGIALLKAQLAAATSLQPPILTTVTAFVNQLSAISL